MNIHLAVIDEFDERMKIGECDILQDDDGMLAWRALRINKKRSIVSKMPKSTDFFSTNSSHPNMVDRNARVCAC